VSDLWPLSAVELGAVREGTLYHKILLHAERFLYRHATACQGQGQEILDHIQAFGYGKPLFLYRNLKPSTVAGNNSPPRRDTFKIVYAGLLGVAQNILSIVRHIDFKALGAELHIYGGGNQTLQIQQYVNQHDCGIIYHGYQPKETINSVLEQYHASIVPLSVRIKGAVPSKIFDLLPHGIPILFSGGGEGENIIKAHGFGLVSPPGDSETLKCNIIKMKEMSDDDYRQMRLNCINASLKEFSFEQQMKKYKEFVIQPTT
jgi:glycosyltransferase involved in cell wall biosynthesis